MLYDQTGSEKSNMAASKPEVAIYELVVKIETKVFCDRNRGAQHTCRPTMVIQQPKVVWKETRSATQALSSRAGMTLSLPEIEQRHALTGSRSATRLAIDTILDRTIASPLTSFTGATASAAECVMCVSESYGTGYTKG